MSELHQIKLLGREYALRSEQSQQQIQRVVALVEKKLAETAGRRTVDTRDLTVLTLLNLAGEYLSLKDRSAEQEDDLNRRLTALVERLQAAAHEVD